MDKAAKVLISGYNGKMGKMVRDVIDKSSDFSLWGGFDVESNLEYYLSHPNEVPPVASSVKELYKISGTSSSMPDIVIDFSRPEATSKVLEFAYENQIPIIIATTGISGILQERIESLSKTIPIFKSSNMSYGVYTFVESVAAIANKLTAVSKIDIEISEAHHRGKVDSPSGTAITIANAINEALGGDYKIVIGRKGSSPKEDKEIGIVSLRGGATFGKHTVHLYGEAEEFEFTHTALSRKVFAEGAINVASFLLVQEPGLYGMADFDKFIK